MHNFDGYGAGRHFQNTGSIDPYVLNQMQVMQPLPHWCVIQDTGPRQGLVPIVVRTMGSNMLDPDEKKEANVVAAALAQATQTPHKVTFVPRGAQVDVQVSLTSSDGTTHTATLRKVHGDNSRSPDIPSDGAPHTPVDR